MKVISVKEEIENRKETRRNVKRKYEQAEEETEGIRMEEMIIMKKEKTRFKWEDWGLKERNSSSKSSPNLKVSLKKSKKDKKNMRQLKVREMIEKIEKTEESLKEEKEESEKIEKKAARKLQMKRSEDN